jgi:hypothetical protein
MHIYEKTEDGIMPRHIVDGRQSTLRDFRKWRSDGLFVAPSVTTVMGVINKPGLMNWKIDQYLKQAFFYQNDTLDFDQLTGEWKRLAEAEMDKAMTAGTNFHQVMSDFILGKSKPTMERDQVLARDVMDRIEQETGVKHSDFKSEYNFYNGLYAGQIDAYNDFLILDFKTKMEASKFKNLVQDDHIIQLAAYRQGVQMPDAVCANVYVCLENGDVKIVFHDEEKLIRGLSIFNNCLSLWYTLNNVEMMI